MKKLLSAIIALLVIGGAMSTADAKTRVGVYDSRVIYVWYFRTAEGQKAMTELRKEHKQASDKGDSATMKKLGEKAQLMQRIAHDKCFGRGSVGDIMEKFSTELKQVAKNENLDLIVSKWELNYASDTSEKIDITEKLLRELKADENILKMIGEMANNPPVPDAFFIED